MSNRCVHCDEAWNFDDYGCPCCGRYAVEQDSRMKPTLKHIFLDKNEKRINDPYSKAVDHYDVIRISTGKSVFEEEGNYYK